MIDTFFEYFRTLQWEHLNINRDTEKITIEKDSTLSILETSQNEREISFLRYDQENDKYNPRSNLKSIKIDKDFDLSRLLYIRQNSYDLSYARQIKAILDIGPEIECIEIKSSFRSISTDTAAKTVKIPIKKFEEILGDAQNAFMRAKRYRSSIERYLLNQSCEKHSNRRIQGTTNIEKGEFDFLIHRLNLNTKKKKTDFEKYLNEADVGQLEQLLTALVKNDVFRSEYLIKLNNFFTRENLKDIIKLGKEILALKSTSLKTVKAKAAIGKVTDDLRKVRQMESLWQKYFEKYLLFLIFSYKAIFPKIELIDIKGDKKYPDFVGINHYNGVDIIEIKTHLKHALVYDKSHKNFAFSSELSKAIIQTMNYMDAIIHTNFKNPADKKKITNSTQEENLNRPRGIIIISSADKLVKNLDKKNRESVVSDFTKLRNSLHNIEILTFDEVINIAHDYMSNVIEENT